MALKPQMELAALEFQVIQDLVQSFPLSTCGCLPMEITRQIEFQRPFARWCAGANLHLAIAATGTIANDERALRHANWHQRPGQSFHFRQSSPTQTRGSKFDAVPLPIGREFVKSRPQTTIQMAPFLPRRLEHFRRGSCTFADDDFPALQPFGRYRRTKQRRLTHRHPVAGVKGLKTRAMRNRSRRQHRQHACCAQTRQVASAPKRRHHQQNRRDHDKRRQELAEAPGDAAVIHGCQYFGVIDNNSKLRAGARAFSFVLLFSLAIEGFSVIQVLTAGFGDGHNTAARSVAEALRALQKDPVEVSDLFLETLPRLTRVLQSAYQSAIIRYPSLWRLAYRKLADSDLGQRPNRLNQKLQHALENLLVTHQPRCLVSTYPFYSTLLAPLRSRLKVPPLITVITDSVSVHPTWINDPSDLWCVADAETMDVLLGQGLPAEKIRVTGFPVSPRFAQALDAPGPRKPFPSVLYLPSTPVPHVAATLEALRPLLHRGVRLTLPAGKHASRLHHVLTRFGDSVPAGMFEVLGWTDRMPDLLCSHDVVICKAGGAILHEVLAARTPAVIDYVVPGQEEGNAEMLLKHGCALRSFKPEETAQAVAQMLAENGRLCQQMRGRMVPPLSLPDAAERAARVILGEIP